MPKPRRRLLKRLSRALFIAAVAFSLLGTFSMSARDETAYRSFVYAVERWQTNPDFRSIASEYCVLGSEATAGHICGIPVRTIVMSLRSCPGLPEKYSVNSTSHLHYENFSRGPLVAYLFLCTEQDLPASIHLMEGEAKKNDLSDEEMAHFLKSYNLGFPICHDEGACRSMAATFADSDAARHFDIRDNFPQLLMDPIRQIATDLHFSPDPVSMTFDQQHDVLDRLDGYLRTHDKELWRTKQINDAAAGIWAQAYGPPYTWLIKPVLWTHDMCRLLLILLPSLLAFHFWRKWRGALKSAALPETQEMNISAK